MNEAQRQSCPIMFSQLYLPVFGGKLTAHSHSPDRFDFTLAGIFQLMQSQPATAAADGYGEVALDTFGLLRLLIRGLRPITGCRYFFQLRRRPFVGGSVGGSSKGPATSPRGHGVHVACKALLFNGYSRRAGRPPTTMIM